MVSSSRPAVACILLIIGAALYSQAQNPAKTPSASISGKVTIKDKGVPGLTVVAVAINDRSRANNSRYQATTDTAGKYRITNLPEGNYQITPYALAYVVENERATLMVAEGETIEDVNFSLVQGGVITGKVTDAEGQPLIEEAVHVTRAEGESENIRFYRGWIQTDDRGIYRVFGLRAGPYKVSAGASQNRLFGNPRRTYKHTFHPSTTEAAKATIIEVSEGSEVRNVDIVMTGRAARGFAVAGRIVDGESGKPLSNIVYGLTLKHDGGSSSMSGPITNAEGEFKFENVSPGKYSVYIKPPPNGDVRANPISIEVTDRDITGLTIRTTKGASLSGVVVFEGADEKQLARSGELYIQAFVGSSEFDDHHNAHTPTLKPDGTFRIIGLRGGTAHILLRSMNRSHNEFVIVRVERDGVPQLNNTIDLKEGEQVQGVRVIVNQFSGAIRGQVKIEGGELPSSASMFMSANFLDDNTPARSSRSESVDSRGRFYVDALKAGRYEVQVSVLLRGPQPKFFQAKKEVTVADNTVTEVIVTVKLNP